MTERLNLGQTALLSRAYPFVAVAFALTPVLGSASVRRAALGASPGRNRGDRLRPCA